MDLCFSDVTQPYYDEARIASDLFSDYEALPLKPYRDMIKLLFKSCRKELKRALKLRNDVSKSDLRASLKELRSHFNGFKRLKREEPSKEEAAETAETLPSVVPDNALLSSQTASL